MTVPDQKASAEWYGRIFDPQLFQERDPPPRYYVRMGTAYIAFGGTPATDATPKIDHFCALVKDYKPDEMRAAIEKAGIKMGAGRFGMPTDDDGIRLQLLAVSLAAWQKPLFPPRASPRDNAAIEAVGLDHIVLAVTDLDRSSVLLREILRISQQSRKPARSGSRLRIRGWRWSLFRPAESPPSSGSASASQVSIRRPLPRNCKSFRWKQPRHKAATHSASETRTDSPSSWSVSRGKLKFSEREREWK